MRVALTGPTGAIGHALINLCIDKNDEVLAICHKGSKRLNSIPKNPLVKVIELDGDDYSSFSESYDKSFGEYDIFYHFAWGLRQVMEEIIYRNNV